MSCMAADSPAILAARVAPRRCGRVSWPWSTSRRPAIGHTPVGFINPTIYSLAEGPNYNLCFHDITTGNNTWSGSPTLFYAVPGYDLCTGWGTPDGTNLINALVGAGPVHVSPPPPPYGSALAALNYSNPNGGWELFLHG